MGSTKQVKYTYRVIVLVGFMGCGKSTLGRGLARALGTCLVDLDKVLARQAGQGIPEIFRERGEEAFRRLETGVLRDTLKKGSEVISAGGGLVTQKPNLRLLRQSGALVVWIDPSWKALWKRLRALRKGDRPLLKRLDGTARSEREIRALWSKRRALYEKSADVRFRVRGSEQSTATLRRLLATLGVRAKKS